MCACVRAIDPIRFPAHPHGPSCKRASALQSICRASICISPHLHVTPGQGRRWYRVVRRPLRDAAGEGTFGGLGGRGAAQPEGCELVRESDHTVDVEIHLHSPARCEITGLAGGITDAGSSGSAPQSRAPAPEGWVVCQSPRSRRRRPACSNTRLSLLLRGSMRRGAVAYQVEIRP
jgi:hypothetical protein